MSIEVLEYQVPGGEDQSLYVRAVVPEKPWAVLQIAHGMAEHAQRYDAFARAMAAAGIAVFANDHAGHGRSARENAYGYFYARDGWGQVVADLHTVRASAAERHPGLPYIMLGHSMGSMLARSYIARFGEGMAGVILSGTVGPNPVLPIGRVLAAIERVRLPRTSPCKLLDAMSTKTYNKAFAPARTGFEWLTREEAVVDDYVADPACGFVFTATGYRDMFAGMAEIQSKAWQRKVPRDLPVLIFSGDRDPVGGMGKGVRWVERHFRDAGVRDVTCTLYPEGRHEMLNEQNREQVYADALAWIRRVVAV